MEKTAAAIAERVLEKVAEYDEKPSIIQETGKGALSGGIGGALGIGGLLGAREIRGRAEDAYKAYRSSLARGHSPLKSVFRGSKQLGGKAIPLSILAGILGGGGVGAMLGSGLGAGVGAGKKLHHTLKEKYTTDPDPKKEWANVAGNEPYPE